MQAFIPVSEIVLVLGYEVPIYSALMMLLLIARYSKSESRRHEHPPYQHGNTVKGKLGIDKRENGGISQIAGYLSLVDGSYPEYSQQATVPLFVVNAKESEDQIGRATCGLNFGAQMLLDPD